MLHRKIDSVVYCGSLHSWNSVLETACFAVRWFTRSCQGRYRCHELHEAVMSVDSGGFQVCHAIDLFQALRMAAKANPQQADSLESVAERLRCGIVLACC